MPSYPEITRGTEYIGPNSFFNYSDNLYQCKKGGGVGRKEKSQPNNYYWCFRDCMKPCFCCLEQMSGKGKTFHKCKSSDFSSTSHWILKAVLFDQQKPGKLGPLPNGLCWPLDWLSLAMLLFRVLILMSSSILHDFQIYRMYLPNKYK